MKAQNSAVRSLAPVDEVTDWRDRGACRNHPDPDLWFPEPGPRSPAIRRDIVRAKTFCNACPVKAACLANAIETDDQHSIAGGLTAAQRHRMGLRVVKAAPRTVGELVERIRDLAERGFSDPQIGKKLDEPPGRVEHLRRKNGIRAGGFRSVTHQLPRIVELRRQGLSNRGIARVTGISDGHIGDMLRRYDASAEQVAA